MTHNPERVAAAMARVKRCDPLGRGPAGDRQVLAAEVTRLTKENKSLAQALKIGALLPGEIYYLVGDGRLKVTETRADHDIYHYRFVHATTEREQGMSNITAAFEDAVKSLNGKEVRIVIYYKGDEPTDPGGES